MKRANRLILDANLLVFLVVGTTDQSLLSRHKRTRLYTVLDFEILQDYLEDFPSLVTTPNIVSEASNLLRHCDEKTGARLADTLRWFLDTSGERYVPSIKAAGRENMPRLGITDCAILELLDDATTLLTSDVELYLEAVKVSPSVKNFNHLRDEWM